MTTLATSQFAHKPTSRLRVVMFASGSPMSVAAIDRVRGEHDVVGIIGPKPPPGVRRWLRWLRSLLARNASPLAQFGIPVLQIAKAEAFIRRSSPDLVVVASFPQRIPSAMIAPAAMGALNLHMSLLPRHRGPDPTFWTYWNDDSDCGVSVHWIDEIFDHGPLAAQVSHPLERGNPSRKLYAELTDIGTELLAKVLREVSNGSIVRMPQADNLATRHSRSDIRRASVPFAEWPAERVWHVLAGLGDQWFSLLADQHGRRIAHGQATSYRLSEDTKPGEIGFSGGEHVLNCRDGLVYVESGARFAGGRAR